MNKNLFNPVAHRSVRFSNAIAMAPMTRSRAIDTLPNELMATYYAQRATAGLIITEGNAPSPNALGYARTPGIYSAEQLAGWTKVTDAVHRKNGKIFTQLMHVGRIAHSANIPAGAKILAPSGVVANSDMWTDTNGMQKTEVPLEMSGEEIQTTIKEFVTGALNAIKAGFDGIELHGANGYLLEQFLNPNTNQRKDQYGGSIENRIRFVVEVTRAVADAIGKERVGVRISPFNVYNDMALYDSVEETYLALVQELAKLDVVYVHLIDYAIRSRTNGVELIKKIRAMFPNILILNGGYNRERAENALLEDGADMVSFGSPFISNPDLPLRLRNSVALTPPDASTFYTPGPEGYIDYVTATLEVA